MANKWEKNPQIFHLWVILLRLQIDIYYCCSHPFDNFCNTKTHRVPTCEHTNAHTLMGNSGSKLVFQGKCGHFDVSCSFKLCLWAGITEQTTDA